MLEASQRALGEKMKLERISISNFKGIRSQSFEPSKFSCLVGENNAGKSTVIQAIVYALNRPTQLPQSHFYDPAAPVTFELRFSSVEGGHIARLAEEAQQRIAALVIDGNFSLRVQYAPGEKVAVTVLRRVPIEVRYQSEAINNAFVGKRGQGAIEQVIADLYPEFKAAQVGPLMAIGEAKALISAQIEALANDQFTLSYAPLPTGIASSIAPLLPEPIYIPAVKNLNDDLKTTQTTSFGRLLGLLLEDMTADLENINHALRDLNALFNRVREANEEVDNRHEKVRQLEGEVEGLLGENFPNVKVQLHIPPPELKTILNTAQIFIDDGSYDLIDNKGDGIKRSLTFALLQAYVKRLERNTQALAEQGIATRPLLFLFEEPELYLHPRSQRVLFGTLAGISNTHQVVVTTHSPMFFEPGVTASFVRVAKRPDFPKPAATLYPVNFELNAAGAEAFRLARFEHADAAFFSQGVVLLEGESDDAYCRHVARMLNAAWDFDKKNIALVKVSGKGNFQKFRTFFESFGITVKIVADLDALFDGFHHLGATEAAVALKSAAIQKLDARIAALGTVAEPNARQIKKRVVKDSWRAQYVAAREALRKLPQGAPVDAMTIGLLDGLFAWEKDITRQQICTQDAEAAAALVPLLDSLRDQGICVLARGAIEDYYPANVAQGDSKPDRALAACSAVATREQAVALAGPLAVGRASELEEVFGCLFAEIQAAQQAAA
jgi:putative ATP-dependent endonuclease of OLD family